MQERRENSLCYYCDEKFHTDHKCTRPKLFLLEGIEVGQSEEKDLKEAKLAIIGTKEGEEGNKEMSDLLGISLHVMASSLSPKTKRIEGCINHQNVLILIDIGSTHKFVDPYVARKLKLKEEKC